MYIIIFGVFIIKFQISVSEPQFPPHIDLHKVGEAIFNNEKFNILRPTTHVVTDHFKEFMLRTESSYNPAQRVFIDNNGFRHNWSGFGEKTKSLRKTDLKRHVSGIFENASVNTLQSNIISTDGNDNTTATVENNHQEVKNASDNNGTVVNLTEEDTETSESKETTTIINLFLAIQKNNSSSENTIEKSRRQGRGGNKGKGNNAATSKNKKAVVQAPPTAQDNKGVVQAHDPQTAPIPHEETDVDKPNDKKERTVAKTTFFCPYLGIITMSAFID